MGAPPTLTPELIDTILKFVASGSYFETAATAAGVPRPTFYYWLKQSNNPKANPIYKEFRIKLEKAAAEAELKDILRIAQASQSQWQAAAWRLERRYPDRWGKVEKHNVSGEQKVTFVTQIGDDGSVFRIENSPQEIEAETDDGD